MMTTHELIQRLDELKLALWRDTDYIQLIETIAQRYSISIKGIDAVLNSKNPHTFDTKLQLLKNRHR